MKKIRSVKAKIATGVIAATVIGSSTFAFANTNAGTQFGLWGQAQIDTAKSAIESAISGSRTTALGTVQSGANSARDTAKGNIDTAGANEKAGTKSAIEVKLAEHVAS
ncbi:hypothetical protein V7111_27045, partial [Neobacillus niacini]|uniref:hypothetical protein n=1 Tax=Neobacillus niacini TaxID=86668 RepID=UPI003002843A